MNWSKEAHDAVSKVPFFVRRRVKKRVEEDAIRSGASTVTIDHVKSLQKRFLNNMENEVKGHQVELCFGQGGCPNRAIVVADLSDQLENLLASHGLKEFLKSKVQGPLKMHHEFRVSISDCPNACSRPQIVDLGLLGASRPRVSSEECTRCGNCVEICREDAILVNGADDAPRIDLEKCVLCGQCVGACTTGTLEQAEAGYRIIVGGKLGRHPQLATEVNGIHSPSEVIQIVDKCLKHYKKTNLRGERFGEILNRTGLDFLKEDE